jgi:hypothetical protein
VDAGNVRKIADNDTSNCLHGNRMDDLGTTRTVESLLELYRNWPSPARNLPRTGPFLVYAGTPKAPLPRASETKEEQMNTKRFLLAGCAILILSAATAQAGPCNTVGKAASTKDAGSGPTAGYTGQTMGTSREINEHPPTSTMNRAAGDAATSSQDAQKQMQGQPTAAQQAQGAEPSAQAADKDC